MSKASKPIKDKRKIQDMQEYLKVHNERNYILFIIGITTGYRSQDLVDLKIRDIQKAIKEKEFCIMEKKREKNYKSRGWKKKPKPRIVVMQPYVRRLLIEYIKGKQGYDYAFQSQKGGHITVDSYGKILRGAGKYFKLDHIAAHTPRKIYAYKLYIDSGKNIELVRQALGHSTTLITERYLGLDRDAIEEYSKGLNDLVLY
ncbi:tyrosine-type recombinase/integrase [uncultured Clostridium sp.]|uniref:tyrosine-type recombinase/integrase n=1 Tax=uncultured Clostridium sp. TaxID=59620 RepID=UPI002630936F|nr:tyrosine-type recombinase/integrase [uncultured Clostridium sp.]